MARLFSRSAGMPASSWMARAARWQAMDITGALETCQAAAPRCASNSPISKRVSGSVPHQPLKRGRSLPTCRSWMKRPATPPGPELRYL